MASSRLRVLPVLLAVVGLSILIPACGDEEVPAPTTPAPAPTPTPPTPAPEPTPDPPAVPTGLRISASGETFIEWSWTPVPEVSGYDVQYSTNEAFTDEDEVIERTAEQISYRREGLAAETRGYLRVRSAAGTGDDRVTSGWSTHLTGMTTPAEPTVPAAPTNVRVTGHGSDYLVWSWDEVAGAAGYHAQHSGTTAFSDDSPAVYPSGTTTGRITGLEASTDRYLRVRAYFGTLSEAVYGPWSATSQGTTESAPAPPTPTKLPRPTGFRSTAQDDESISLAWDVVAGAESYEVEQRAGTGGFVDTSCDGADNEVTVNACVATGLEEATEYDFQVRAIPASDAGRLPSDPATLDNIETTGTRSTPPPSTVEGAENDLNIIWESDGTSITWRWDQVADRSWKYQVYYYLDVSGDARDVTTEDPCEDPDLAFDGTGTSDNGWAFAAADGFATRHASPTFTRPDPDDDSVALLCVQTVRKDARGVSQYGNLSWMWASTTPTKPTLAGTPYKEEAGDTKTIYWNTISLHQGFEYAFRLVSAPPEEADAGTSGPADGTDQDACEAAGKKLPDEDSGSRSVFTFTAYDVTGLSDYTSYHLCYRAQNADGSSHSEWAIPEVGAVTLPPQPSTVTAATGSVDHDADLEWSFAVPDGHPQDQDSYTIELWAEINTSSAQSSFKSADCGKDDSAVTTYTKKATSGASFERTRTRTHVRFIAEAEENTNVTRGKKYYICVQSKVTDDRVSKWRLSNSVTQKKDPGS